MTTLQQYLKWELPTLEQRVEVKEICFSPGYGKFRSLGKLFIPIDRKFEQQGKIDLFEFVSLKKINLPGFILTSLDFLNTLPSPEELEELYIWNNNIQPTDISIFSRFINLKVLKIGTTSGKVVMGKRNKFFGSFESWKDLSRLESICIEATDVNEGLEYLPFSLAKQTTKLAKENSERSNYGGYGDGGYAKIECSCHQVVNFKCKAIQDQLRPYNYDLEAWQLAHPHLIYEARPEIFFDSELKSKWLKALRDKTTNTQTKLNELKEGNDLDKVKRIKRLELKLKNLKLIQENISNHALIDKLQKKELVKKEDKATQTDFIIELKK